VVECLTLVTLQSFVVALLVAACATYATWKLMPATPRRSLATWWLRSAPVPGPMRAALLRAAQPASGCGCDGCDRGTGADAARPGAAQPVRFAPRVRR